MHTEVEHPQAKRAYEILYPDFKEIILRDQDLLNKKPEVVQKTVEAYSVQLWKDIVQEWGEQERKKGQRTTSVDKWNTIIQKLSELVSENKGNKKQGRNKFQHLDKEIILTLLYPRLDVNVSKTINHLLKAPFCIHPKTDKVCVPFTIEQISSFDPFNVPTYQKLSDWFHSPTKTGRPIQNKDLREITVTISPRPGLAIPCGRKAVCQEGKAYYKPPTESEM